VAGNEYHFDEGQGTTGLVWLEWNDVTEQVDAIYLISRKKGLGTSGLT